MAVEIPPSIARLLLLNNEWKLETVKKRYLTDPLQLLVSQRILPPRSASPTASDSPAVMATVLSIQKKNLPIHPYLVPSKAGPNSLCAICFSPPSPNGPKLEFFPESSDRPVANPSPTSTLGATISNAIALPTNERSLDLAAAHGLYGLSCGHRFCANCWSSYLALQVSEASGTDIQCMATSCNILVPEDFLLTILKGSPMKDKYLSFIFKQMVTSHPLLRFCSGTDCSVVIHALEPPKARRVECGSCHQQFCFICGDAYHAPASCDTMKRWTLKCQADSGTSSYMQAHTKDCPECHVCIEKNGGCNHMSCTKCNHQFCWVCLQPWSIHQSEYYSCSRYDDPAEDRARLQARDSLKRYVFHYDRWANHERSLQLEQVHRARVLKRINEKVMNKEGTWIDWQYLLTAADRLRDCRYTLKYTYPFAYFSENLTRKELFEYQQAMLELEVEELSWKIEHAEVTDRADLQNAMDVCEKHRLTLLQEFLSD
ncbi:Ariadne RBR E3 ubiquitin protein ligase 2 [Fasciolopsis buskii]|uniref:RBR-type E3 ubiquitin transferase n=1 Tax=Fasciolopsis buskii TaxID=27845 RepID=A0A8E0VJ02_9TREM|nr:Ariadne RBR E3 ubiquitin protein ligase 2 [Fasciolopsis buski]